MTNEEPIKYELGQKIVVRSPITTNILDKGHTYKATVIDIPEHGCRYPAICLDDVPSITYATLIESVHLNFLSWEVVGEDNV